MTTMEEQLVPCVGHSAPDFAAFCVGSGESPRRVTLGDYAGRWLMLIFYPHDFSFVCPTELTTFSARMADFKQRECEVLGISVDSIEVHQQWLAAPEADGGLGQLQFPLASDPVGEMSRKYGVWVAEKAVSTRGLFMIDPAGVLQYAVVHNLSVGRSADETLRVLDALRTGGLCPAGWTTADGTVDVERALQPGRVLGHYRIQTRLGTGTFGTVFSVWDIRLERATAIKILNQNVFESRDALLREARAVARLNHPNVCTIYTIEEEDGLPIIAMEYLDGTSLCDVISAGLSAERARQIAGQIASGLAAAHRQNIVHGDLKPANVMVTSDGTAKILDFGLAMSLTGPTASSRLAHYVESDSAAATIDSPADIGTTGALRGTPAYMSPEQAAAEPLTTASDAFSFGLLYFELLTGRRALSDESIVKVLVRLSTEEIAPELVSQVAESDGELLMRMLARRPEDRPAMTELVNELNAGG